MPGQEQLVRALVNKHGAHLRKSGMLLLCNFWRLRSQLWVPKKGERHHARADTSAAEASAMALTLSSDRTGGGSGAVSFAENISAPLSISAPQAVTLLRGNLSRLLLDAASCMEGRAACNAALTHRCRTHFLPEVRSTSKFSKPDPLARSTRNH